MSEIRSCPLCGELRYSQGAGSHLVTGAMDCAKAIPMHAVVSLNGWWCDICGLAVNDSVRHLPLS